MDNHGVGVVVVDNQSKAFFLGSGGKSSSYERIKGKKASLTDDRRQWGVARGEAAVFVGDSAEEEEEEEKEEEEEEQERASWRKKR